MVTNRPASVLLATALLLAACGDSNTLQIGPPAPPEPPPEPEFLPVSVPVVEAPPDIGQPVLISTSFDLGELGFRQDEFFLAGTASSFVNTNELGTDGRWQAEPGESADYRTRVLVYRPEEASAFSGTVIVEWLNVTQGFDVPASWGAGHVEALRRGHAWVNVTAQRVGIEGSEDAPLPLFLNAADPERYASLSHPGDSFSYDIFSQVSAAIRSTGDGILGDLEPEVLIATGESQSASRLLTYINAVQPLYGAYDAFLVDSRYDSSQPLAQAPQTVLEAPERVQFRDDLAAPVINFQSETDVLPLGAFDERQPDSNTFRLWEVAGAAHNDNYQLVSGRDDTGEDPAKALVVENDSILGLATCSTPINSGPLPWVYMAALNALDRWVREGQPAAEVARLELSDDESDYRYDETGNVIGGLRTPYVDAPAARLSGELNDGGFGCRLSGTTALLDAATMASRYVDQQGYVQAVTAAADDAVERRVLLPEDAARIREAAVLQWQALTP